MLFDIRRSGLCLKKISDVSAILRSIKELLLRICKRIDDYEQSRINIRNNDLIFVSFKSDGVYLNKSKLIDKRATLQIAIMRTLMEKHLLGILHGTDTGLNTLQISSALKQAGFKSFDLELHIRQSIYRIRRSLSAKYDPNVCEKFIHSSKGSGRYKIGKNVVLICDEID